MIRIDEKYNVVLTFSPVEEITGHWFEVYEYYVFLKENGYRPCMLYNSPGVELNEIVSALTEKYNSVELDDLFLCSDENIIGCPYATVIVVDGNFESLEHLGIKIVAKNILGFGCGSVSHPMGDYKKAIYLLDQRIYGDKSYSLHYPKKIYADILKRPKNKVDNTALFYITKNCRLVTQDYLEATISELGFPQNIVVTNQSYKPITNTTFYYPPLKNIFELFSTYVYTPVPRKFDCSSRFIAECALFNKEVIYDIDYYDIGLEIRKKDIDSNDVWIKKDDKLLEILANFR